MKTIKTCFIAGLALIVSVQAGLSRDGLTSPKEQFGFEIGTDYMAVNYTRLLAYWETLDAQSDRLSLQTIGTTAEGRKMVMAVVTSPANHKKLDRYREISRRL